MLNKQTQLKLTDLMQDQYTDLDIYREKPFTFKAGKLILIVAPVKYIEHDIFLKEMAKIIIANYEIFSNIEFLTHQNYKDKDAVEKLVDKVKLFTADYNYKRFKKQAAKFICRWAFVTKQRENIKLKHNKRLCKKFLNETDPSEFTYILFLIFVQNFDCVKKNLLELMKIFNKDLIVESSTQTGTSSDGISRRVVVMPKFSREPFSQSDLNLLEQQSKL